MILQNWKILKELPPTEGTPPIVAGLTSGQLKSNLHPSIHLKALHSIYISFKEFDSCCKLLYKGWLLQVVIIVLISKNLNQKTQIVLKHIIDFIQGLQKKYKDETLDIFFQTVVQMRHVIQFIPSKRLWNKK